MTRITTTIARSIATAITRRSWNIMRAADRQRARGEHLEAWAERLAARWGVGDDVLATLNGKALSS